MCLALHFACRAQAHRCKTANEACCLACAHPMHVSCRIPQLGFLGGRLAIRRALNGMKGAAAAAASLAILHNRDGAPLLPEGISASISHKRHMAVALVQSGCEGHLGTSFVFVYRTGLHCIGFISVQGVWRVVCIVVGSVGYLVMVSLLLETQRLCYNTTLYHYVRVGSNARCLVYRYQQLPASQDRG